MKKLYFDIETLPAEETSYKSLKYLFERKKEKKSKRKKLCDEESGEVEGSKSFEDFLSKTSFDGGFGRVLCIAYAVDDKPVEVLCNDGNERKTLEEFWNLVKELDHPLYIGHNVMDFDLRFLYQRSVVLKVKPTDAPSFARYRNDQIYDTMKEWTKWGQSKDNVGLEYIALALGIPTPKEGIDGSKVAEFYRKEGPQKICDYCKRDVETTRAVYKRMSFESQ